MAHVPGMVAALGTDMAKVEGRRDRQMIHGAEKAESRSRSLYTLSSIVSMKEEIL